MDILLILIIFLVAWILGHALDKVFTQVEILIKGPETQDEIFTTKAPNSFYPKPTKSARLYLIPSVTDKAQSQS